MTTRLALPSENQSQAYQLIIIPIIHLPFLDVTLGSSHLSHIWGFTDLLVFASIYVSSVCQPLFSVYNSCHSSPIFAMCSSLDLSPFFSVLRLLRSLTPSLSSQTSCAFLLYVQLLKHPIPVCAAP